MHNAKTNKPTCLSLIGVFFLGGGGGGGGLSPFSFLVCFHAWLLWFKPLCHPSWRYQEAIRTCRALPQTKQCGARQTSLRQIYAHPRKGNIWNFWRFLWNMQYLHIQKQISGKRPSHKNPKIRLCKSVFCTCTTHKQLDFNTFSATIL